MSDVKSFRFDDETNDSLEYLSNLLGLSQKAIIEDAIGKVMAYCEYDKNLCLNFQDNVGGINNPNVEAFLDFLKEHGKPVVMYGNGDRVYIDF